MSQKPCDQDTPETSELNFTQILIIDVFGFTDVLIRFWVKTSKVKVRGITVDGST